MEQVHKRFTDEQIRALLKGYTEGRLERGEVEEVLGVGKSRFFAILKEYRQDPEGFSISYRRNTPTRIPDSWEKKIERELKLEKGLVEDPDLPITSYNYSAVRDRLAKQGVKVSLPTVISRAKAAGCWKEHSSKRKVHDREVVTASIGALIQHDASHHLWSPYAEEKWALITSLDDFSRKMLFADFFASESTWAHIQAAEVLARACGIPFRYYVDSLRVFRFVQKRDSIWRKHVLQTDEADPQWKQVMAALGVEVTYALSPQAKGKIERPYRWLQDRIVRTCALEKISTIEEARMVLRDEVKRYNDHQVHSTTGEIPSIRFERARAEGNSLFRPFVIPAPYTSSKDVFCLRDKRIINGYRKLSYYGEEIRVPKVDPREHVELHLIPIPKRGALEMRIWCKEKMVYSATYPLSRFPHVHL